MFVRNCQCIDERKRGDRLGRKWRSIREKVEIDEKEWRSMREREKETKDWGGRRNLSILFAKLRTKWRNNNIS